MLFNRRQIVKFIAGTPIFLKSAPIFAAVPWQRSVVLVELNGGNDGLNTVIPYADPVYSRLRPKLAISKDKVLQLNQNLGFHLKLQSLMSLWDSREMAIVLGVGYPGPSFSHFRSIDIWETASLGHRNSQEGWVPQLFREIPPPSTLPADGVFLGRNDPGPLMGYDSRVVNLRRLKSLKQERQKLLPSNVIVANSGLAHVVKMQDRLNYAVRKLLEKNLDNVKLDVEFPMHDFGKQMELAARLIIGGSGIPVIKCSLGGFDTHAGQAHRHPKLLEKLAGGLSAFARASKSAGVWNEVLVMTYAEFGRRPKENASGGTDHGTAAPHFILGGRVRGGFYGEQPPLNQLHNDNLVYRIDFRELYAAVARNWWGLKAEFIKAKSLPVIM